MEHWNTGTDMEKKIFFLAINYLNINLFHLFQGCSTVEKKNTFFLIEVISSILSKRREK
jgi:hypothetical protein